MSDLLSSSLKHKHLNTRNERTTRYASYSEITQIYFTNSLIEEFLFVRPFEVWFSNEYSFTFKILPNQLNRVIKIYNTQSRIQVSQMERSQHNITFYIVGILSQHTSIFSLKSREGVTSIPKCFANLYFLLTLILV
jgi:hypothetical protein